MLKIHRRDNGSCFRQIIGIQFDLAYISDKKSLYIFFADIGGNDALSYRNPVLLIVKLGKAQLSSSISSRSPSTTQLSSVLTVMALTLLLSSMIALTVAQFDPTSVTIPTRPFPAITLLSTECRRCCRG